MLFNEFLETTLTGGLTPTDKLKQDLSTFKTVFNYATKTDVLYNNLIDNIVNLLKIKFGSYQIIYNSVDVMYRELLITLNPQIPQFLMIQKKQLIENLNTFGDLSNWGDILKDNVSRELNLQERGENSSGYIPIDGNNKDPYSTNDISKNNITNENTDVSRLATDYLNFYAKLTWSVADIELNYIYESYIHLFKIYYDFNDSVSGTSGNDSLEYELDKINAAISVLGNEIDATNTNVSTNTTKISEISNLKADKTQLDNYYTKTQSDSRYAQDSEITNLQSQFNNYYTKTQGDSRYARYGDISNLQEQINTTNSNVARNTTNITTMNSTLQTNSTNIVNLNNEKANKNDVYLKTQTYNKSEIKRLDWFITVDTTVNNESYFQNINSNAAGYMYGCSTTMLFNQNDFPKIDILHVQFTDATIQYVKIKPIAWELKGGYIYLHFVLRNDNWIQRGSNKRIKITYRKNQD